MKHDTTPRPKRNKQIYLAYKAFREGKSNGKSSNQLAREHNISAKRVIDIYNLVKAKKENN